MGDGDGAVEAHDGEGSIASRDANRAAIWGQSVASTDGASACSAAVMTRAMPLAYGSASGDGGAVDLELVALVVDDYDEAIAFFVDCVGFELVEDSPSTTNDGRPKRWVVVRPPHATTGILLARADGEEQVAIVGRQHAGRVGFFLRVDDFAAAHDRMEAAGVTFVSEPREESYGRVAVFLDVAGNRWDLLGPVT